MAHGDTRKEEGCFVGSPKDFLRKKNQEYALTLMRAFKEQRDAEKRASAAREGDSSEASDSKLTTGHAP